MSANVDERIVQMQFDNQQFEAKAQNTITTLNSLTQALQLPTANTKGFDQIQNAANQLDFSKLNQAIDTINYRFSTFGIMATQVLQRVTNAAMDMGKKLVDSVTTEPIRAGFSEYELKMDSVKRILNSAKNEDGTAVSLEQVNERLDELNTYADKTIYNFMDMTQNIGKFTNAGVDLDKSVLAIQGIANEAALAGANSQEASRAMYNFAQALSSGYVKLIDWKSIENANMATVGFKEQLIATAVEMGTLREEGDKYVTTTTNMNGKVSEAFDSMLGFNDSLAYQWMTADVLTTTLAKYADETTDVGKAAFQAATEVTTFSKLIDTLKEALGSGWTETWQWIIGDFEEAKGLWTAVNNVLSDFINSTAEARNGALKMWKEFGGRNSLIAGLSEAWAGLSKILSTVGNAFISVFRIIDFRDLLKVSSTIRELGKSFHDFVDRNELPIYRISRGIFSAFDLIGQVISAVYRTVSPIFKTLGEVFGVFGNTASDAASKFTYFVIGLKRTDAIYNGLQRFVQILKTIGSYAISAGKAILEFFGIKINVDDNASFVGKITAIFEAIAQNHFIAGGIDMLTRAKNAIVDFFTGLKDSEGFQKVIDKLTHLGETLGKIAGVVKDTFVRVITGLGNALKKLFGSADNVDDDGFNRLFNIGAVALIAQTIKKIYEMLKGLTEGKSPIATIKEMLNGVSSIKDLFSNAKKALSDFATGITAPLKTLQESIKADILIKIAEAVAILAASAFVLAMIDPQRLGYALGGLAAIMTELGAAMTAMSKLLSKNGTNSVKDLGSTFIMFSAGIAILAIAVKALAELNPDQLINGVVAVGILMALMTAMTKLGDKNLSAKGLLSVSIAVLILQVAVKRLADIDPDQLVNGVIAVGILMALMTAMSKLGGKNFSGAGMIAVAAAVLLLQKAVATFGDMDLVTLAKGVGAVSILLVFMGLFSRISGKGALTASIGTIALAFSLGMLQKVVAEFGAMNTEALGNGLLALAASLAAMAIALNLMTGTLSGAAALLIAAMALRVLLPVMEGLAAIPFTEILKGVAGLALVFGVLIVAGTALGPLIPVFIGFAGAIALVGIGILALGAGLLAAGAGLTALSVSLVAGTASIISSIGLIIAAIIEAIPFVVVMIAKGIIAILQAIGDSAVAIVEVVVQIGVALIEGLRQLLPPLGEFLMEALAFIIQLLTDNLPTLVEALLEMVITLIDGIALAIYNNTDRIMAAIHHVLGAIIDFVLAMLQEFLAQIPGVGSKISRSIQDVRDDIGKTMNSEEGRKFGADFADGVKDGVASGKEGASSAGTDVGEAAGEGMINGFAKFTREPVLVEATSKLKDHLSGQEGEIGEAGFGLGEAGMEGYLSGFGNISESGLNVDQGLANGMLDNQDLVNSAAETLGLDSVDALNMGLGVNSPSTKTWETGQYVDEGLANGIVENQETVRTAVAGLGSLVIEELGALSEPATAEGSAVAQAYASGISDSPAATVSADVAHSAIEALESVIPEFNQNGINSGETYAVGIKSVAPKTRESGIRISRSAITGIDTLKQEFTRKGSAAGDNYASGIRSKLASAESAGKAIAKSAADGATDVDGFYKAGSDSGQGYIDGLKSKAKAMAEASAQAAADALQAAKDAIESASPSKAYFRLGEDSDEGYILGAQSKAASMKATMAQLAKGSMSAFYDGLSRANLAANDELIVVPTVAPVMDMNNVYGGVDFLRTVFNGTGEVLGSITADVSNNVADIRELRQSTRQILKALNSRKPITLDGKTVIGWVDAELGAL